LVVTVLLGGVGMAGVVMVTVVVVPVGGGGSSGFAIVVSELWGAILISLGVALGLRDGKKWGVDGRLST
jgi:hypothetical protein